MMAVHIAHAALAFLTACASSPRPAASNIATPSRSARLSWRCDLAARPVAVTLVVAGVSYALPNGIVEAIDDADVFATCEVGRSDTRSSEYECRDDRGFRDHYIAEILQGQLVVTAVATGDLDEPPRVIRTVVPVWADTLVIDQAPQRE